MSMGSPWQDGAVAMQPISYPGQIMPSDKHMHTPSGITVARNPDFHRRIGRMELVFAYDGENEPQEAEAQLHKKRLWLLVEVLHGGVTPQKGAVLRKRGYATWFNPIVPNWPHLRTQTYANKMF